ncbi:MAG TPA: RNA polymerase sigma factor, partial [Planctomycetota bacterium]|nr:RNA polymerase sigma factor [Planctomycetota bacterium]
RACRDLPRLRRPGSFACWFLSIVRNAARDHIEKRRKNACAPLPEDLEEHGPDPAEAGDFQEYLWRKVKGLPEATREAIFLYYHEGESTRSVARSLGISITAVKSRLDHGRSLLGEKLWREMERCFRGSRPSEREWSQRARRLTLGLAVSIPASQAAAGATASAVGAGSAPTESHSRAALAGGLLLGVQRVQRLRDLRAQPDLTERLSPVARVAPAWRPWHDRCVLEDPGQGRGGHPEQPGLW